MEYSIALKRPGASTTYTGWEAIDLRTGQTLWTQNYGPSVWLRMGQILDYVSPNQFGGLAYLWSTEPTVSPNTGPTYGLYDAMTGTKMTNLRKLFGCRFHVVGSYLTFSPIRKWTKRRNLRILVKLASYHTQHVELIVSSNKIL